MQQIAGLKDEFSRSEKALGFVPNSFYLMGRIPRILKAFSRLAREVIGVPSAVPTDLKRMVAHMASRSAGCQYCMAHTAESAANVDGVSAKKIEMIYEFERNNLFSEGERAALSLAQSAGQVPNTVTDGDMDRLKLYFSEDQIVEIVSVISLFGWLNRFNDTMATDLEQRPLVFGQKHLSPGGWNPEKHI
ncbi:MAG: fusion protein [Rhodospirillaceae bacterium]|nr:fusion protein [Rhodospirillaceae bacterium]